MKRLTTKPIVMLVAFLTTTFIACSAPSAEVYDGEIVDEIRQGIADGDATFDHGAFDTLLSTHVDADTNRVRYSSLQRDADKLQAYLKTIADADLKTLGADEQHALLINAYNGYTLQLILEHYPELDSIRDISDPWGTERYVVAGHRLSLDQIEHQLIRPIFKDPRIHFAVNCAAIDCPPLRPFAYTGEQLNTQLEQVTRNALRSDQFVRIQERELKVTNLFNWYEDDFIDDSFHDHAPNIAQYIAQYTTDEIRQFIEHHDGDPPVSFLDYDWALNDVEQK